jgi:exopolyphosphatase/pppGpp-phosphohydrolase
VNRRTTTSTEIEPPSGAFRSGNDDGLRVAVIEVGSRATRLLVADVSQSEGRLIPVHTQARETHLMRSVQQGGPAATKALSIVEQIVGEFRDKAVRLGAARTAVFGTAALRTLSELAKTGSFSIPGDIQILDRRTEALYSLLSASNGIDQNIVRNKRLLVIDQGGGSIEFSFGRGRPTTEMTDYRSVEFGDDVALKYLKQYNTYKEGIAHLRKAARLAIEAAMLPTPDIDLVVVQGSVATKWGWLRVRTDLKEDYNPRRVHGYVLEVSILKNVVASMEKATPRELVPHATFVDPRNPKSGELDRVFSGLIVLLIILEKFGKDRFTVSSQGTRHGFAWNLASQSPEALAGAVQP